ncbi:DUF1214 domain-containing protein [Gordonia hydrophobica]|uniref:DUF1214 domain-containing protein n=1 Tax=Gordonia hydrophobica TaxID=40516 RepID=A0ABZ2U6F8_9ACTN|nr:DUF1214 domain-containing protein [Gordonia hydrophobica]MBM7365365.1 hypothetical protein [Gordonia hydrophobica]
MSQNPIPVTVDNFARAETARMFAALAQSAGGSNRWKHARTPTRVEEQTVIRMNRDTLYSFAVLDVAHGGTVTVPDADGRYISVMIVTEEHHIPRILHDAGTYQLTADEVGSDFVLVAARILVDPQSADDVAVVAGIQDGLSATSTRGAEFVSPEYDPVTLDEVRGALKILARGVNDIGEAFGRKGEVERLSHLIGAAFGWGGLPKSEALYLTVSPQLPVGDYHLRVADVPVDAFWSVSVYNADGFFEPNDTDSYNLNSITAVPDADGAVTVRFGGDPTAPNTLPIVDGWNYLFRLYRPRPEAASWTPPPLVTDSGN